MRTGVIRIASLLLPSIGCLSACLSLAPDGDAGADSGAGFDGSTVVPDPDGAAAAASADAGDADSSSSACTERLLYQDLDGDGYGDPMVSLSGCTAEGFVRVAGDCNDRCPECNPASSELCDGENDEDCDDAVDEGCTCESAQTRLCGLSEGLCEPGTQECVDGQWGECLGQVGETAEVCDGLDQNCSGQADETFLDLGEPCRRGVGSCEREGVVVCSPDGQGTTCSVSPGVADDDETCGNLLDDDCDGETDEAPANGCCVDAHCAPSDRCSSGLCVARTYCQQQSRPTGVASTDYVCEDFDAQTGLPDNWHQDRTAEGVLETSAVQAYSAPRSLFSSVASDEAAQLEWSTTGATPIQTVELSFRVQLNALAGVFAGDFFQLGCVATTSHTLCAMASDATLAVVFVITGSAPSSGICEAVDGSELPSGAWSQVELSVHAGSDVGFSVDGEAVDLGPCSARLGAATSATVSIGTETQSATTRTRAAFFDDVQVSVIR